MKLDAVESSGESPQVQSLTKMHIPPVVTVAILLGFAAVLAMVVSGSQLLQMAAVGVFVVAFGFLGWLILKDTSRARDTQLAKTARLLRLAHDNGWQYVASGGAGTHAGTFFTAGNSTNYSHVIAAPTFEVGECTTSYGSGRSKRQYRFAYLAMPLDRHIPNMLLDSKSNNVSLFGFEISNLPITYDKSQIVSLEGDFDKYFTLYAPGGYDTDVRYVFTPDLMQLLIAESDSTDIEIIDNTIVMYMARYDMTDVAFWRRIESIVETVGTKITRQTENYKDDRTGNGTVSFEGRRLKRKISIIAIAFAVLAFTLQFIDIVITFLGIE